MYFVAFCDANWLTQWLCLRVQLFLNWFLGDIYIAHHTVCAVDKVNQDLLLSLFRIYKEILETDSWVPWVSWMTWHFAQLSGNVWKWPIVHPFPWYLLCTLIALQVSAGTWTVCQSILWHTHIFGEHVNSIRTGPWSDYDSKRSPTIVLCIVILFTVLTVH